MASEIKDAYGRKVCEDCQSWVDFDDPVSIHICTPMVVKLQKQLKQSDEIIRSLWDYIYHDRYCIRTYQEAGEPTENGGYRTKFKGKWYQSRPINEEPKCDCGFDEMESKAQKFLSERGK